MNKEFPQIAWDERLAQDWRALLQLALREDLGEEDDWTTVALVPDQTHGRAAVVARKPGVIAGLPAVETTLHDVDPRLQWHASAEDGQILSHSARIGWIEGPARAILIAERLLLNLLGRLSGIATLTRRYVDAVQGTKARIYDTRKTTPGWRRLEKYAVRCGGGQNHRGGLNEAVLIKDNHIALGAHGDSTHSDRFSPADAVRRARQCLQKFAASPPYAKLANLIVEVEVDTLAQLDDVLHANPDIVLLDNMSPTQLAEAVAKRDASCPTIELEASGGIDLHTVRAIAESGVDRISVGALTHSALSLDIALDWLDPQAP